jgi:hypothetical protein
MRFTMWQGYMFGLNFFGAWSPTSARERLRKGRPPRRMRVTGRLGLAYSDWLTELPRVLVADSIDLSNCTNLPALPERIECDELNVSGTGVRRLGAGLEVARSIDASNCRRLQYVDALRVPELRLRGCTLLERLSDGLNVRRLNLSGCVRLAELPASIAPRIWNLDVSGCTELNGLPERMFHLHTLNVGGCVQLKSLPDDIQVQSWIEVADSGLETLPYTLRSVRVLWRGMLVPDRIAFSPDTITADEVLRERNVEFRRVLIERMGMERFIEDSHAETLDRDLDAGGPRRLLRVPFEDGEDMVCLEVHCPSTGRRYVLRVPPGTQTCAHAAAWVAGFSNPRYYRPVVET